MSWFKQAGIVFRPVSPVGWIIAVLALAVYIQIFVLVDSRSHSVSDILCGIFPYSAPTLLLWLWISSRMSGKPGQ